LNDGRHLLVAETVPVYLDNEMTMEDDEAMKTPVQGLWIGGSLSAMEQLSIASFLSHGHDYHLYTYEPVSNVPRGAKILDGEQILPRERLFRYTEGGSWSGFSNFFRFKLLLERGGWWFDTDFICLQPLRFANEHVFGSEIANGRSSPTSGAIKAPRGSPAMAHAWSVCEEKDPEKIVWGETGPALVENIVETFHLKRFVEEPRVFCPVSYRDWKSVLDPDFDTRILDGACTLHLWNEMWRRSGQNKDRHYHPASPYERLRRKFLGNDDRISIDSVRSLFGSMLG
jgi:hypothetical protein